MRAVLDCSLYSLCTAGSSGSVVWDASWGTHAQPFLGVYIYIPLACPRCGTNLSFSVGICRRVGFNATSYQHLTELLLINCSLLLSQTIKYGPRMWQDSSPIVAQNFSVIVGICALLALTAQWSFAHQFSKYNSCFWSAYFAKLWVSHHKFCPDLAASLEYSIIDFVVGSLWMY